MPVIAEKISTMEDINLNPISGEQVPYADLKLENQNDLSNTQNNIEAKIEKKTDLNPASAKEFVIEKRMKSLKRWIIILGSILVMLLIALVSVLAIIAQKPVIEDIKATPLPTIVATPVENENIPKNVVSKVQQMQEKVNSLNIEENELSFPNFDWYINY